MILTTNKAVGGVKFSKKILQQAKARGITIAPSSENGGGLRRGAEIAGRARGMGRILLALFFGLGGLYLFVKSRRK